MRTIRHGLHAVTSLPRQPRTPSRRSPDDLSGVFRASPAAEIDSDNQSEIAVSGSAAVFQSRRVALKRSQHAAVTRYRYFGCLGPLFLHQLFFGQDIVPVASIKRRTEMTADLASNFLAKRTIFWTRLRQLHCARRQALPITSNKKRRCRWQKRGAVGECDRRLLNTPLHRLPRPKNEGSPTSDGQE